MSPGFARPLRVADATDRRSSSRREAERVAASARSRGVVELAGIEPATSALQRRRSPS